MFAGAAADLLPDAARPEPLGATVEEFHVRTRRALRAQSRHHPIDLPPLPEAQRELLFLVERQPGVTVGGSAEALRLAPNTVSTLVRQLVGGDLLERRRDPLNQRIVHLHLTPRAVDRLSRFRSRRTELLARALERLDVDSRVTIAAAMPALRQLLAELESLG